MRSGAEVCNSAFSVLYIFIVSFSTSVLFSKRRISVNLVELVKSFQTRIYLQKSASMQPRTNLAKNQPKVRIRVRKNIDRNSRADVNYEPAPDVMTNDLPMIRHPLPAHMVLMVHEKKLQDNVAGEETLVERFDIEPFPDFSAK